MKYYLHDSNSFNDEKITQLYIKFGYEGLGLFYTILEKLANQEKPTNTEVLKHQLKIGKRLNKCWLFMEQIDLISSNNGETFNKQLLNFSEKYKIKKEKNRERISQWRDKQEIKENVTRNKSVRNIPKVNRSKENVIEVKEKIYKSFDHLKISIPEYDKLIELGYSKLNIDNVLCNIENYRLNKKYKSLYLTSINWLKKDFPQTNETKSGYKYLTIEEKERKQIPKDWIYIHYKDTYKRVRQNGQGDYIDDNNKKIYL